MDARRTWLRVAMILFLVFSSPAAPVRMVNAESSRQEHASLLSHAPGVRTQAQLLFTSGPSAVDCGIPLPVTADADSWVDQNSPTANFALSGVLKVQSQVGGNSRALVRFSLPPAQSGCILGSARLYMSAASAATGRILDVIALAGDWSEDTVNWNNQPGVTGAAAAAASDSGLRYWDVTHQVQAMYDTGFNHGFLIHDRAEGGSGFEQQFASRESSEDGPQLLLRFISAAPHDPAAPDTVIAASPLELTLETSASFHFTGSDDTTLPLDLTFECRLDGQSGSGFVPCTSPFTYSGLGPGEHTFEVRTLDKDQKLDLTPAYFTWTLLPPGGGGGPLVDRQVSCGQVLTVSTRLLNNLSECPEDGLVIGAHGIIVDLNGRTVDGVGLGTGIRNDGFDSVTVRNGTVQEFDYGVRLSSGAALNVLETLTVHNNQITGIELVDEGTFGNQVRGIVLSSNADGIALLEGSAAALVLSSSLANNSGLGLYLRDSHGNLLGSNSIGVGSNAGILLEGATRNTLLNNTLQSAGDGGILITIGSDGNRLRGNFVSGTSDAGFLVDGSNRNQLIANTVTGTGDSGITISEAHGNQLIGNTAHDNSDSGISLSAANDNLVRGNDVRFNPGGIELGGSSRNLIEENDASLTMGSGIELGPESFENWVLLNLANGNSAQGISVGEDAPEGLGNLIEKNTANENDGGGIQVGKGGSTVRNNVANRNRGWGIYAGDVNVDGGGNVALGNAEPAQCFNVICNVIPTATPTGTATGTPTPLAPSPTSSPALTDTHAPTATPELTITSELDETEAPSETPEPTTTDEPIHTPEPAFTLTLEPSTQTVSATPEPTDTPVPPTMTPTITQTVTATLTPTPEPPAATATQTPSPTLAATDTPTASATLSSTPTSTSTATPTSTATFTATATHTFTSTASATATRTPEPAATFTPTLTHTSTSTLTASVTASPTTTSTHTATATPTFTPTATRTASSTPTATYTITATASHTATHTASPAPTATQTFTPTATYTSTPAPTGTPTATHTFTATATWTASASATAMHTPSQTALPPASTPTASMMATASLDPIFADGFESGDLSAWSGSVTDGGDLSVSPAAALIGGRGLQVLIDDNNPMSVTSDHPASEPRYRVRFHFDPNSISMAGGDAHIILRAYSGSSTVALRVEFGSSGGGYQMRAGVVNDGSKFTDTAWFALGDGPHVIELDWRGASGAGTNNGSLTLWIDGIPRADLADIDNDTRRIDRVTLGALAGIDSGTRGTYYFDAFESHRTTGASPLPTTTATPTTLPQQTQTHTLPPPTSTPVTTTPASSTGTPISPATATATSLPTTTPPADLIFADGFESGTLSDWSASIVDGGDLSVSTEAALVGGRGLQAVLDDNTSIYVTDDRPGTETQYRARFYFDPNSIRMSNGNTHAVFYGYSGTSTLVLRVQFRFSNGAYQLRAALLNDRSSWANTAWFALSDAPHLIELGWRASTGAGANNGELTLWIDQVQRASLVNVDNDTRRIDRVRLGAVAGIDSGTRGTYYFDAFESRRLSPIEP
ncbi:MAG TPA: NosD domain-containing protein [Anaerolineales bacterium]|nr:NosD domain-containing protein [Anaerolineales bacterium]